MAASTSATVRVAVTQAEPVWFDLPGAVQKACTLIKEAADNKAQLVAFPEVWIPGYPNWIWYLNFHTHWPVKLVNKSTELTLGDRTRPVDFDLNVKYIKNSLRLNSPEMDTIRSCARENDIAVSMGFSENIDNSVYIAQALIGPDGEIKVHRRKMKPTHMERTVFGDASGDCLTSVAQLPFARVGQLSCWEHIQPLLKFHTMAQGEQIHVAAWPSLTPHSGPEGKDLWSMSAEGAHSLSATYAVEASAFVLHCTPVLTERAVRENGTAGGQLMSKPGGGCSAVFGPDGRRLTEPLSAEEEGIVYADLQTDDIVRARMFAHVTGHYSRPDLLWLGVDPTVETWARETGAAEQND